jgi:hypothetical protein
MNTAPQPVTVAAAAQPPPAAPAAVAQPTKAAAPPLTIHGAKPSGSHSDPLGRLASLVSTHELVPGLQNDQPFQPVLVHLNLRPLASNLYTLFFDMHSGEVNNYKGIQTIGLVQPNGAINTSPVVVTRVWITALLGEIIARNHNQLRKSHNDLATQVNGPFPLIGPMAGLSYVDACSSILLAAAMPLVMTNSDRHFTYYFIPEPLTPSFSLNGGNDLMEFLLPIAQFAIPLGTPNVYDSALVNNLSCKMYSLRSIDAQSLPSPTCVGKSFSLYDDILMDDGTLKLGLWMDGDGNCTQSENAFVAMIGCALSKPLAFEDRSDWMITDENADIRNYTQDDFRLMIHAPNGLTYHQYIDATFQRSHYRHIRVEVNPQGVALRDGHNAVMIRTFESFSIGGNAEDSQLFRFKCKYYTKLLDSRMYPAARAQAFRKLQYL